jgi:3-hydroxyisobutyrate dehydrogenase-like beta-hydroxyacid dehydrogenase
MAKNLLGAGHDLMVHNRTKEKAEALEALGAKVADSPKGSSRSAVSSSPCSPARPRSGLS